MASNLVVGLESQVYYIIVDGFLTLRSFLIGNHSCQNPYHSCHGAWIMRRFATWLMMNNGSYRMSAWLVLLLSRNLVLPEEVGHVNRIVLSRFLRLCSSVCSKHTVHAASLQKGMLSNRKEKSTPSVCGSLHLPVHVVSAVCLVEQILTKNRQSGW